MSKNELQRMNTNAGQTSDMLNIDHETQPVIARELERRRGLMDRLFPTPADKEVFRNHLALIQTHNDFTERSLQAFCEVRLKALGQLYRDYLVRGSAKITAERTAYVVQEKVRLEEEINRIADDFIRAMDARWAALDSIRTPVLRQAEERRILSAIDQFHGTIARLMRDFQDVLDLDIDGPKTAKR